MTLRIRGGDGRESVIRERTADIDEVVARVVEETRRSRLASVHRALDDGRQVAFGPLSATTKFLFHGSRHVAWSEVATAAVEDGMLEVRVAGRARPWARVQVGRVPNADVLVGMTAELRGRLAVSTERTSEIPCSQWQLWVRGVESQT